MSSAQQASSTVPIESVARQLFLSNQELLQTPASVVDVATALAKQFTPEIIPVISQMQVKDNAPSVISKILPFLPLIMAAVEKVENMSGAHKKAAVMTALKTIVTTIFPPPDAILLCLAIDTIISPAVDMACLAVEKLAGKIKKTSCFRKCFVSSSTAPTSESSLPTTA